MVYNIIYKLYIHIDYGNTFLFDVPHNHISYVQTTHTYFVRCVYIIYCYPYTHVSPNIRLILLIYQHKLTQVHYLVSNTYKQRHIKPQSSL